MAGKCTTTGKCPQESVLRRPRPTSMRPRKGLAETRRTKSLPQRPSNALLSFTKVYQEWGKRFRKGHWALQWLQATTVGAITSQVSSPKRTTVRLRSTMPRSLSVWMIRAKSLTGSFRTPGASSGARMDSSTLLWRRGRAPHLWTNGSQLWMSSWATPNKSRRDHRLILMMKTRTRTRTLSQTCAWSKRT